MYRRLAGFTRLGRLTACGAERPGAGEEFLDPGDVAVAIDGEPLLIHAVRRRRVIFPGWERPNSLSVRTPEGLGRAPTGEHLCRLDQHRLREQEREDEVSQRL